MNNDYDFDTDLNSVDETDEFAPIPPGKYVVQSVGAELKDTSSGGKMVSVQFQVVDGEFTNRRIFENYNLQHHNIQTVQIAQKQIKQWVLACGVDANQRLTMGLIDQLEGKEFLAHVIIQKDKTGQYGDQNRIRRYEQVSGSQPAGGRAPAPKPQVAQQPQQPPSSGTTTSRSNAARPWER